MTDSDITTTATGQGIRPTDNCKASERMRAELALPI
jgi:hypothetical protein